MKKPDNAEWDRMTRLVGLTVATGYLANERPQSLLLVGNPGVGKSSLLARFAEVPTVRTLSDVTSDPLRRHILPEMSERDQRTLIMPELIKVFQRNPSTTANTVGLLTLAMTGEVGRSYVGNEEVPEIPDGWCLGLIGAMTTRVFQDWRQMIANSGLLSRMHVVHVRFSEVTQRRIEQAIIDGDRTMTAPVAWPVMPQQAGVVLPRKLGKNVLEVVDQLSPVRQGASDDNRNRLVGGIRVYLKAAALMAGRSEVKLVDVDTVSSVLSLLGREHTKTLERLPTVKQGRRTK